MTSSQTWSTVAISALAAVIAWGFWRNLGDTQPEVVEMDLDGAIGTDVLADQWVPVIRDHCMHEGAMVVRITSPGGSPGEAARIASALRACHRTVYTVAEGVAASAALLPLTAGNEVILDPYALVGGMGIVKPMTSWASFAQTVGVADQSIASGPLKLAGSPLRTLSEAERASIERLVSAASAQFRSDIAGQRPKLNLAPETEQGALITAGAAREQGIGDRVGTIDALQRELPGTWQNVTPTRPQGPQQILTLAAGAITRGIAAEISTSPIE
ncbi:hypothetical protein C7S18_23625 (plasmid) [Ahniella affigens]|uniref:Peptidase S49 domain-containing protein n=1 Tax=Ahniella affigens TaxID=2021234 RepID=A0A2P1PZL7_9GAMM|nr:S49 family peptidase [Ahniella affigens]AVQ00290.1 hypothetical protein C7S18_23625 [Ahniella affigens]